MRVKLMMVYKAGISGKKKKGKRRKVRKRREVMMVVAGKRLGK